MSFLSPGATAGALERTPAYHATSSNERTAADAITGSYQLTTTHQLPTTHKVGRYWRPRVRCRSRSVWRCRSRVSNIEGTAIPRRINAGARLMLPIDAR